MIEARDIGKRYSKEDAAALSNISAKFGDRGFVAICGPAACGKTTLLNILGGIERPDSGELFIDDKPTRKFNEGDWNEYRNARVGFAFQDPVLVGHRTVLENVELALTIAGVRGADCHNRALEALRLVGAESWASKKPADLSGAQQRIAGIARALAKEPDILLADDPTCGLDKDSAETVAGALERVAQNRLVIMATSDEELAANHAGRILRLAGGELASDETVGASAVAGLAARASTLLPDEAAADSGSGGKKRRSMPFFTAIGYSIRNISAKKGRAVLTAIASAISMIGIATIISLGGGANNLIDSFEEASIATDPIVIGKSGLDLTGLLDSENMKKISSKIASENESPTPTGGAKVNSLEGSIENVSSVLSETISHIRDNDLSGFKQYVDSNSDGILNHVDAVQYDYGVVPLVFNGDTSHGVEQLNPSALSTLFTRRANSTVKTLNDLGCFNEMVNDQSILEEQMDVVYGTWPKSFDECVVVLDSDGGISDLTLYYMGLYDHAAVDSAMKAALNGEEVKLPESPTSLSYEQLANSSFVVLPRVSLYQKNAARGTWADKSLDKVYVADKIAQDGIRLKVSGIVQPKKDVLSPLMSEGVGYTSALAERLIEISAQSEITQQQAANPTVDVFTNRSFEDLKAHPSGNLDLDNIVTINEQAIRRIFSVLGIGEGGGEEGEEASEPENEQEGESAANDLEVLGVDLSQIDWSQFEIDTRDVLDAVNAQRLYDAIALASMLDPAESGLELSEEKQAQVSALTGEMVADFTVYAVGRGATAEDLKNPSKVKVHWDNYLKTDEGKMSMAELDLLVGQSYSDLVSEQLETYLTTVYAEVIIDEVAADIIEQAMAEVANQIEKEVERQVPVMTEELRKQLEAAITSEIDRMLVEFDNALGEAEVVLDEVGREVGQKADAVANEASNIVQININEEDFVAFMNNLYDSSEIGYDNNMAKLGYSDKTKPLSMSIYPKNLGEKQKVVDIIGAYNDRMEKAGMHDRTIIYNNASGDTSQALSGVVGVVGVVLLALIGVSLIVGTIMMVVITLTGISERRREMGLLRALGASRGNLMAMFNTETFVIGLLSGVIAVGVVLAVSAGVNNMVAASSGGVKVMSMPPEAAVGLIALSGVLPLVAGLVPSFVMSFKNLARSLRG